MSISSSLSSIQRILCLGVICAFLGTAVPQEAEAIWWLFYGSAKTASTSTKAARSQHRKGLAKVHQELKLKAQDAELAKREVALKKRLAEKKVALAEKRAELARLREAQAKKKSVQANTPVAPPKIEIDIDLAKKAAEARKAEHRDAVEKAQPGILRRKRQREQKLAADTERTRKRRRRSYSRQQGETAPTLATEGERLPQRTRLDLLRDTTSSERRALSGDLGGKAARLETDEQALQRTLNAHQNRNWLLRTLTAAAPAG